VACERAAAATTCGERCALTSHRADRDTKHGARSVVRAEPVTRHATTRRVTDHALSPSHRPDRTAANHTLSIDHQRALTAAALAAAQQRSSSEPPPPPRFLSEFSGPHLLTTPRTHAPPPSTFSHSQQEQPPSSLHCILINARAENQRCTTPARALGCRIPTKNICVHL
jgi:hypothetical protein